SKRDWSSDVCSSDLSKGNAKNSRSNFQRSCDVMATISIQKTQNIAASIDYVLGKNDERVMCRSGHNVNPYDAKFQMRDLQFQFGKEKGFIQGYTFVQSFSLNDFPNKNDKESLELANKITLETLKALDPNTQTLVVTHNDGESG